jgi:hypothetical protein
MEESINKNVTLAERNVRAIVGIAILTDLLLSPVVPFYFATLSLLSLYLLFTALVAWDPIYAVINRVLSWLHIGDKERASIRSSYA